MVDFWADFSGVSLKEWKTKIINDLNGKSFNDLIRWDDSGLPVLPFYNKENSPEPMAIFATNPDWSIIQTILVNDEKSANLLALNALNEGASALLFDLSALPICNFDLLLKDIGIAFIETTFIVIDHFEDYKKSFENYVGLLGINVNKIMFHFRYHPLKTFVQNPVLDLALVKTDYLNYCNQIGKGFQLSADAALFQNAGATTVFQLALLLAELNEYLNWLFEQENSPTFIPVHIQLATGTLFFEEISKIRAASHLIALLFEAYDCSFKLKIGVETSDIYRSPVDNYTNLIRDSISGMAAVIGGCNELEIHAFDKNSADKKQNNEGKRLALNQQLIFKEESYLNKVNEMGNGSFYLERRTEEIASAAWKEFKTIEAQGGFLAFYESGTLKQQIEQQAAMLIKQYKDSMRTLIGSNKFINNDDNPINYQKEKIISNSKGLKTMNIAKSLMATNQ